MGAPYIYIYIYIYIYDISSLRVKLHSIFVLCSWMCSETLMDLQCWSITEDEEYRVMRYTEINL